MSGAVKQLRASNPNTVFSAAGDLIGASTFESFIQNDKPTIDALNEAGLEVSAAGNHEFDQGYDDLLNRVMAPYDATTNPEGGAEWEYIAANVRKKSDNSHALGPDSDRWIKDFGDVEVGFIGAVTEDLPSLVSPSGIADIKVTGIIDEVNASADVLESEGADVIVLLVHEGAPDTSLASATSNANSFGRIVNGVDTNIDAIVSGHTHLAYNHAVPVPAWQGRAVTTRPVVSAGQYGANLNQLVFSVDSDPDANPATDDAVVTAKTQAILPMFGPDPDGSSGPPRDPAALPRGRAHQVHRGRRLRQGRRPGIGEARPARRPVPSCPARLGLGEPWWRVHPRQPRRRGAALGHGHPGGGQCPDRLHEPRWPARRHGGQRRGRVPR